MEEANKEPSIIEVKQEVPNPENLYNKSRSNSIAEIVDPNLQNTAVNSKNVHKPIKGRRINFKYKLR